FRLAFPDSRILLAPAQDKSSSALLAVDHNDLVIGATRAARQSLGLTAEGLRKQIPAADIFVRGELEGGELQDAERAVLQRALARSQGNVAAAARLLGISRATLHRKLNRLEMGRRTESFAGCAARHPCGCRFDNAADMADIKGMLIHDIRARRRKGSRQPG
ncbi:hypothetical protein DOI34_25340, partial [Salmonella enterica subsp. enterica serovar Virchow]|nr:hypothetical protein [Salmonella enterica subsp. enterica serovar Virchow]